MRRIFKAAFDTALDTAVATAATAVATAATAVAAVGNMALTMSLLGHFMECDAATGEVAELTCESAARGGSCSVYMIGTKHYSQKSREEVKALIELVKPEAVFVELSPSLAYIMEPENASLGGEFHVANMEAMKLGAKVILGDRPMEITLERFGVMGLFWEGLVSPFTLSYFNFARMIKKKRIEEDDIGAFNLARDELERIFPSITETFVYERDQYMSAKLLEVAREHKSVVAVVGTDHLRGIQKHWKQSVNVEQLLVTPPRTRMVAAITRKLFGV